jgi:hypothetical protein
MGGRRWPRMASGCGGRRGFFFGGWGNKWTPAVGVAAPTMKRRRSASSRATQGGEGKMAWTSVGWARGGQGGARGRTRGLSRPTHFGPKSETRMGARGRLWIALSVWVAPLDRVLCPRERIRTRGGRMGRPAGDALMLSCFTLPLPWRLVPNISTYGHVHISYAGDVCIFFQEDLWVCSFFGIGSGSG